ncbi:nucleotidyltransferase domain-containing protein [Pelagibius sp. Alg239-R121]|uniref:nucleotidyltransferase domain-containing protein n=1 Tax=Pelagibius sp. Alg239-R121 TaxID=2993448 RepID=UPI0024A65FB4|nr:nucleotidyltransferase domain-containing protein [Pelagibius sp. Alg239-R121]
MIDPTIQNEIQRQLDQVELNYHVQILLAVESGSRAWGFPSPDSDYDVRFLYVHRPEWYLTIEPGRDVIELPIEDELDINGWDLKKALQLLIKPNPVLHEWLGSPIIYRSDQAFVSAMRSLADRTLHHTPARYHYLKLGEKQWNRFIAGKDDVSIKKYFYALRPALALRWLRHNPDQRVPMSVPELRPGCGLPGEVSNFLDDLLERKRITRELGNGLRIPLLDDFITEEFDLARAPGQELFSPPQRLIDDANKIFQSFLGFEKEVPDQTGS